MYRFVHVYSTRTLGHTLAESEFAEPAGCMAFPRSVMEELNCEATKLCSKPQLFTLWLWSKSAHLGWSLPGWCRLARACDALYASSRTSRR